MLRQNTENVCGPHSSSLCCDTLWLTALVDGPLQHCDRSVKTRDKLTCTTLCTQCGSVIKYICCKLISVAQDKEKTNYHFPPYSFSKTYEDLQLILREDRPFLVLVAKQGEGAEAEMRRKMRQPQEKSAVSGENKHCTLTQGFAAGSERRKGSSRVIEAVMVHPSDEGTDCWRIDCQNAAEVPELGPGTGENLALASRKSPARLVKAPTASGSALP